MTENPMPCQKCGQPHAKCSAHRRDGTPCGQRPMLGQTVCRMHGGEAPRSLAAAQRRQEVAAAQAAVVTLGLPREISPTEALLEEVRWTAGHVAWLRDRVRELEQGDLTWGVTRDVVGGKDTGTTSEAVPNVWYVLYTRERDHLVKVAAAALKAGVDERQVRLQEQQGAQVAAALRAILDGLLNALMAAGMAAHLRDVWAESVTEIVPRELRRLAGGETA